MILSGRHHCRLCGACICRDCCQSLLYHALAEIVNFEFEVISLFPCNRVLSMARVREPLYFFERIIQYFSLTKTRQYVLVNIVLSK